MYQQKEWSPVHLASEALVSALEFNKWNPLKRGQDKQFVQALGVQIPEDIQIVQVDVGLIGEEAISFGCVFKDHDSRISFATSKRECMAVEPAVAEIMAIRWSLTLASKLGLQRVIMQSDAKGVVDCIHGTNKLVNLELLAKDCRLLCKNFKLDSVMFISRECSFDAHNVAELGKVCGSKTWIDGYSLMEPNSLVSVVVVS